MDLQTVDFRNLSPALLSKIVKAMQAKRGVKMPAFISAPGDSFQEEHFIFTALASEFKLHISTEDTTFIVSSQPHVESSDATGQTLKPCIFEDTNIWVAGFRAALSFVQRNHPEYLQGLDISFDDEAKHVDEVAQERLRMAAYIKGLTPDDIRLMAGEIEGQNMRDVLAVLGGVASKIAAGCPRPRLGHQLELLREAAMNAEKGGQHIYTHPRDSNKHAQNKLFNELATPEVVLALFDKLTAGAGAN